MQKWQWGQRTLIEIRGVDAVRYLNGQVTQDVRLLTQHPDSGHAACLTDAKGRLQAYLTLYQPADDASVLWLESEFSLRELIWQRLERYLIADEVELIDRSDEFWLEHWLGDDPPQDVVAAAVVKQHQRSGVSGWDVWVTAALRPPEDDHGDAFSWVEWEKIRVAQAVPQWGRELQAGMLPPEAGLERGAISYQKGCYIGQEVMSRIKTAGKVPRRLVALELDESVLSWGVTTELWDADRRVGQLTSIAGNLALGYVERRAEELSVYDAVSADGQRAPAAVKRREVSAAGS